MSVLHTLLENIRDRVASTLLAQKLWAHYEAASAREQLSLKLLSAFLGLVAIVLLLILPLHRFNTNAIADYHAQQETLNWMQANRAAIGSSTLKQRAPSDSLMTLANQQARNFGLAVKRYEPSGDKSLSMSLEQVSFNRVVQWLETLERDYGIIAVDFTATRRDEPGMVDVRVVLQG
jgi:general secretion pathway protein M